MFFFDNFKNFNLAVAAEGTEFVAFELYVIWAGVLIVGNFSSNFLVRNVTNKVLLLRVFQTSNTSSSSEDSPSQRFSNTKSGTRSVIFWRYSFLRMLHSPFSKARANKYKQNIYHILKILIPQDIALKGKS